MSKSVIGLFDTYGEAAEVVRDLELAGIVGEQVELVSAVDEEVPFAGNEEKTSSAGRKEKGTAHAIMWRIRNSLPASHAEGARRWS